MRRLMLAFVVCCVFGLDAEASLLSEAQDLYSPERINSTNLWMYDHGYGVRSRRLRREIYSRTTDADAQSAKDYIIQSILSFKFNVSTNLIDDGISAKVLYDRRHLFFRTLDDLQGTNPDVDVCKRIAAHVGGIHILPFKRDPELFRTWSFGGLSDDDAARIRKRWNDNKPLRDWQNRVYAVNMEAIHYRLLMLSSLGLSARALQRKLPEREFASFTNNLVSLSKATPNECKRMFDWLE